MKMDIRLVDGGIRISGDLIPKWIPAPGARVIAHGATRTVKSVCLDAELGQDEPHLGIIVSFSDKLGDFAYLEDVSPLP